MTRGVDAWNRFWFAPQPTSTLALFRIGFGLLTLVWSLALIPDLLTFFGRDGIAPVALDYDRLDLPWTWGLLQGAPADGVVIALFVLTLAASLCVLVGFRTRIAAAVLWLGILSFERRSPFVFNAGDTLIRVMALYLVLAPAGASLSLDRLRRARAGFWRFPECAPWALRLVQVQVSVIYLSTVWEKLQGHTWRDGTAVSYALRTSDIQRIVLPHALTDSAFVSGVVTYGTLATELALGTLIWNRRARPFVIAAGVMLHLFVEATLTAGLFSAAMLTAYLAFVPPETASRWILATRDRLLRLRRRSGRLGHARWAERAETKGAATRAVRQD